MSDAKCGLCPHECVIREGGRGFCLARINKNGAIAAESYGKITALALDPIEKKPLKMFHPGAMILSVGSYGCNLRCPFCQNHEIARPRHLLQTAKNTGMTSEEFAGIPGPPENNAGTPRQRAGVVNPSENNAGEIPAKIISPEQLAALALEYVPRGNIGIAFTYNEPLINYEFLRDTARINNANGLKNVLVSNGFLNPAPFEALIKNFQAANIDLKGFSQGFYEKLHGVSDSHPSDGDALRSLPRPPEGDDALRSCPVSSGGDAPSSHSLLSGGGLEIVKNNIKIAHKYCHVEVTTMVMEGENDHETGAIAKFIAGISPEIPLHISKFFPRHKYVNRPPTQKSTVLKCAEAAKKHLKNVFAGNL